MRYLIDTQCWLWMEAEPDRLSKEKKKIILAPGTELFLSVASAWEISIKYALGKLALPLAPAAYVPDRLARNRVLSLPIRVEHALRVADLPRYHRDPFDRLIVAQAQLEKMTVITTDPIFSKYDVRVYS